jgi:hypothetical protein
MTSTTFLFVSEVKVTDGYTCVIEKINPEQTESIDQFCLQNRDRIQGFSIVVVVVVVVRFLVSFFLADSLSLEQTAAASAV